MSYYVENRKYYKVGLDMVGLTCNPSYTGGGGRRIVVQGQQEQMIRPYLKNKRKHKDWGRTQVVDGLPSKHKVLSSGPSSTTGTWQLFTRLGALVSISSPFSSLLQM
jgi:hypothetical protein